MTPSPSTPASLLVRPATYRRLAHVASALVLGPAWFALLVAGWALGVGLAITLLGIPVLIGLSYATRAAARAERAIANGLLDAGIPPRRERAHRARPLRALWAWLTDPASWREQAFLMWRFVGGLPIAVGVIAVIAAGLGAITAPIHYRWGGGIQFGDSYAIDTLGESLALVPLGAVLLLAGPWLVGAAAAANRAVAKGLLGPSVAERSNWTSGAGPIGPADEARAAIRRRAVGIHAGVVVGIGVVLVAIWALTTRGYFWPAWPLIALAVPLAIHALVTSLQPFGTGARARLRGLWLHAGIALIVVAYLTAVWALSTPGRYFWVIWTMLAFSLPIAAHAVWVAAGRGDRAAMAQRIDTLTATRAGAADAQAAELRRIERDLHDGAQARLVALAMDLGMARERLAGAPPETRALVEDAHEQAKRALVELRDLARGIHPAVLTDRGLAAAIETLAGHCPLPVALDLPPAARAPAAVEAAAYFVVAEALTNAAKHSGAARASVRLAREGDVLRVAVADDGAGGADAAGSGIAGLRRRVEALDGVIVVTSPPGGGTVIGVELPCGS